MRPPVVWRCSPPGDHVAATRPGPLPTPSGGRPGSTAAGRGHRSDPGRAGQALWWVRPAGGLVRMMPPSADHRPILASLLAARQTVTTLSGVILLDNHVRHRRLPEARLKGRPAGCVGHFLRFARGGCLVVLLRSGKAA